MGRPCHIPVPAVLQPMLHMILHGGERCCVRVMRDRDFEDCKKPAIKFGLCDSHLLDAYNFARLRVESIDRERVELVEFMRTLERSPQEHSRAQGVSRG